VLNGERYWVGYYRFDLNTGQLLASKEYLTVYSTVKNFRNGKEVDEYNDHQVRFSVGDQGLALVVVESYGKEVLHTSRENKYYFSEHGKYIKIGVSAKSKITQLKGKGVLREVTSLEKLWHTDNDIFSTAYDPTGFLYILGLISSGKELNGVGDYRYEGMIWKADIKKGRILWKLNLHEERPTSGHFVPGVGLLVSTSGSVYKVLGPTGTLGSTLLSFVGGGGSFVSSERPEPGVVFVDNGAVITKYIVPSMSFSPHATATIVEEEEPMDYKLYQNYPNPFNPTTSIRLDLPSRSVVTLKVYNMLGEEVAHVADQVDLEAGGQEFEVDGNGWASGIYYYRMVAEAIDEDQNAEMGGTYTSVGKMILMK
jgi:hypothetical protein